MIDKHELAQLLKDATWATLDWREAFADVADALREAGDKPAPDLWVGPFDWHGSECPLPPDSALPYEAKCSYRPTVWKFSTPEGALTFWSTEFTHIRLLPRASTPGLPEWVCDTSLGCFYVQLHDKRRVWLQRDDIARIGDLYEILKARGETRAAARLD